MKKIIRYGICTAEIIIDVALMPLFFIKMFCYLAVLPCIDGDGNLVTERVYYHYSALENLSDMPYLVYIAIALLAVSVAVAISSMVIDNKKLRVVNYIIFAVAALFAVIVILLAAMVWRTY
jgi:hypothetical protein